MYFGKKKKFKATQAASNNGDTDVKNRRSNVDRRATATPAAFQAEMEQSLEMLAYARSKLESAVTSTQVACAVALEEQAWRSVWMARQK